ncbi:MAG: efflux RND transporter permease subunit [Acidobacteria bacterium]|nr:efflux RND transporter permease subunit [Acidobacteriota bacterium]
MTEFALRRPVLTIVIYLVVVAFGVFAVRHIRVDLQPEIELPRVSVTTHWMNNGPETIQREITSPIEEVAGRIRSVKDVTSESSYGTSIVRITFEKGANVEFAVFQLKEELASLRQKLPRTIRGPTVRTVLPREMRREQRTFFLFEVSAPIPIQDVRRFVVRQVVPGIMALDGVADVTINGGSERVVQLTLDREKLERLGLSFSSILARVRKTGVRYPAAPLFEGDRRVVILINNAPADLKQLRSLPVAEVGSRVVTLSELGSVTWGYGELYTLSRVNGKPTITVDVEKARDANTIRTAARIRALIKKMERQFPGKSFRVLEDGGRDITAELLSLAKRGGWIFVLVFITLALFLFSVRTPLLIILTILLSAMFTVDLFYLFGTALNFVSLSGLALGFGMMVDNAIVVAESIIEHIDLGIRREDAVLVGTRKVSGSILASTLTTCGGFFSFVFLSGRMAGYYMPLAEAIVFSLLASMFVAFTLIPLVFRYRRMRTAVSRSFLSLNWLYRPIDRLRKGALLTVILVALLGWHAWHTFDKGVTRGGFFFRSPAHTVTVYIKLPAESDVETVNRALIPFERRLVGRPGVRDVVLSVYRTSGTIRITFTPAAEKTALPFQVKQEMIAVASQLAGIRVGVYGLNQDNYASSPGGGIQWMNSSITLTGYSYDKVKEVAEALKRRVLKERRVRKVNIRFNNRFWSSDNREEMVIRFKTDVLARRDISKSRLLAFIQRNLVIEEPFRFQINGEEMGLDARFTGFQGMSKDDFLGLTYVTKDGNRYRLRQLLDFDKEKAQGIISKKNQKYMAVVEWIYRGSTRRAQRFNRRVFRQLELPPGYTKEMSRQYMTEAEQHMVFRTYGIALFIIFLILAAYTESLVLPFAVLAAVPFSLIGVAYIFAYGGYSFDASAYMGMILLFGIVVNNSILLVDHWRFDPKKDKTAAAVRRARPILMTTLTTVVGMLPLVLGSHRGGGDQSIWVSLGIATIGGLTASALLIIVVMPAFLELFETLQRFGSRLALAFQSGWSGTGKCRKKA